MSFPNNRIWMPIRPGSQDNVEVANASTRNEHKRGYQWFVGSHEQELFFNKKQAIESDNKGAISGATVKSYALWSDISSSQSGGHIGDHLVNPKTVQSSKLSQKNVFSTVSAGPHMEKGGSEGQLGIDSSTWFSMSQTVEDPVYLNSGVRKVMVNEIRISQNWLPEFVENSNPGKKNEKLCTMFQNVEQACSKRDGVVKNQFFGCIDDNMLSVGEDFNIKNYDTGSVAEQHEKSSGRIGSTCQGQENFFAMDPFFNKANETFNISPSSTYNKGDSDFTSLTYVNGQQDATFMTQKTVHSKENSMILSVGENQENDEQTTISFGCFMDDPKDGDTFGRLVCSRDILLSQLSAQSSAAMGQRNYVEQITASVASVATSRTNGTHNIEPKTKKGTPNNFPANVKNLLSTGILDGIPVKYISWSREKNLRGVVKGTGYMCSCQDCKLSKAVNAYEFERHAGCKTKHPNNHIYFENGKTIYAVVQELRSTQQDMLFEAIQNATGSPINQKNFHNWKASYKAATRELQRIYGRDDTSVPY